MKQTPVERSRLSEELIVHLVTTSRFLERQGNRELAAHGLKQGQYTVLKAISQAPGIRQNQITSHMLFEKSNLSKIVSKLKKMELITEKKRPQDGRSSLLYTTPAGDALAEKCGAHLAAMAEVFTRPLSDGQLEQAAALSKRLQSLIKEIPHEE